jgi:hypothetical protein
VCVCVCVCVNRERERERERESDMSQSLVSAVDNWLVPHYAILYIYIYSVCV